jgi:sulfopyruvate decarboxylase alpha subunit
MEGDSATRPSAHGADVGSVDGGDPAPVHWGACVADALVAAGADSAVLVPDKRLDPIVRRLRVLGPAVRVLAEEDECVAYAAGRRLAGGRPVVLMQSSGLGNAINTLGSLVVPYGLGIPLVISMRGTLGERNPAQMAMGRATPSILEALGTSVFVVREPSAAAHVAGRIVDMADAGICAAMLLDQELEGPR